MLRRQHKKDNINNIRRQRKKADVTGGTAVRSTINLKNILPKRAKTQDKVIVNSKLKHHTCLGSNTDSWFFLKRFFWVTRCLHKTICRASFKTRKRTSFIWLKVDTSVTVFKKTKP